MAEIKSFPNNQSTYVGAEWVMRWLHGRTSGVFAAADNASVSAVTGEMAVAVSDGIGWLSNSDANGVVWWNDTQKTSGTPLHLEIDTADGVQNRIDRVIVEWKTTNYVDLPEIKILKGTKASNPVAPALTNNNSVRQISLARVSIPAGTLAITSALITDERLNSSVCGLVTESLEIDTSMLVDQMEDLISDYNALLDELEEMIAQAASQTLIDNSVTTPKINDGAVTTDKIADGAVVRDKLATAVKNELDGLASSISALETSDSGKLSKSGDTMTGELYLKQGVTDGTVPSEEIFGRRIRFRDSNNADIGHLHIAFETNGQQGISLRASRKIGTTNYYNALTLYTDASGNRSVFMSEAAPWRKALGLGSSTGALPITVAQGGTGGTTAAEARVGLELGGSTGALPITIAQGGSGQTAVSSASGSSVCTASSGFTVNSAYYRQWGKLAQVSITFKKTTAVTTESDLTPGTIVSGKRPAVACAAGGNNHAWAKSVFIGSDGVINFYGTWPADATHTVYATYILP